MIKLGTATAAILATLAIDTSPPQLGFRVASTLKKIDALSVSGDIYWMMDSVDLFCQPVIPAKSTPTLVEVQM